MNLKGKKRTTMRKRRADLSKDDNLVPTFRHRNDKKRTADNRSTLKLKHKENLISFEEKKETLPELRKEQIKLENTLKMLNAEPMKDADVYREIFSTNEALMKLKDEIYRTENDTDLVSYLLDSGLAIKDYFDPKNSDSNKENYNRYLKSIDDPDADHTPQRKDYNYIETACKECNETNSFVIDSVEDTINCENCGYSKKANVPRKVTSMGFNEIKDYDIQNQYAYKRISHFTEHLMNMQAMQPVEIPCEYITAIKKQIKSENFPIEKLNEKKVRFYLKKLNLSRFYEHSQRIIELVTGKPAPKMSDELIETLRTMFIAIQKPYEIHKPKDRKSFLSYKFILYKFCELLEKDEYLVYFSLLKSGKKLDELDRTWKGICKELNWEYIPTFNIEF